MPTEVGKPMIPPVSGDALTALVEQWRDQADRLRDGLTPLVLRKCADELAALIAAGRSAATTPERLNEFAEVGAWREHRYYTDGVETLESNGHRGRFDDCPHHDCQTMRAYLAAPAPLPAPTAEPEPR